ncbi:PF07614 family protein [Leptospira fainei serovar Hurstbridge str. BUT 6]|uniref:PF07614 family protein n=1 Tax=Leptospira fainei serovar Hurstbridge str. BUT 6 TaxID=1193011 RepID=S3V9W5_9LEPT|nr:DUF1577 domain-containing protein [Leptospira fainei]EPG73230.1 PF07614 family protein [Leptospira fainei serovar Hurstbridge str. BUT 6]
MEVEYRSFLQSPRVWDKITDPTKVGYILKEYVHNNGLFLKENPLKQELQILQHSPDGKIHLRIDPNFVNHEDEITVYKTLSKHMEIGFKVETIHEESGIAICTPEYVKIAKDGRISPRIEGLAGKVVAHRFHTLKKEQDSTKVLGTSGQILLTDLHRNILSDFPGSRLIFQAGRELTPEQELVKRTGKVIFISDAISLEQPSFDSVGDFGIIDLKKELEEEMILEDRIKAYRLGKIKSFVVVPIFYKDPLGDKLLALGYADSKEASLDPSILKKYSELEQTFNSRIEDSNTLDIDIRQNVVNASEGGILLEVTESQLVESFLHKPFFTADLTFKMQAPLRFAFKIRHISQLGEIYLVGAEIVGSNDAKTNMTLLKKNLSFVKSL